MVNVTFKQLNAFVTVARERSFRRAARKLNVSSSALSLAIRELETEIGLRLFDRSTRSVEVAAQATGFRLIIERILDDLGHALHNVRGLAEGQKGSVVVAGSASFITYVVAPAVARLAKLQPGIAVRVVEDTTESLTRRLIEGEVDFGIATVWRRMDDIESWPLLRDRIGVLCSAKRAAALPTRPFAWADLARHPIVALPPGAGIRAMLDHHPKLGTLLPKPAYEVSSNAAQQDLVERDVGIAVIPALAARQGVASKSRIFLPLDNPVVVRHLCLLRARRRSLTPAAAALVKAILEVLGELQVDDYVRTTLPVNLDSIIGHSAGRKDEGRKPALRKSRTAARSNRRPRE